jgi:type II secretory pathway component GspD/PulD (secretin)
MALLKVQVVVSRYQGEKKISSQPFTLPVAANGPRASLRIGTQVPIVASPVAAGPDGKTPPAAYNYKNVGTSIECAARVLEDGRYRLELTIDDSSVASDDPGPQPFAKGPPQFRSFQISGAAALRDGQSTQLTTATEKVTGEIVRIDVTLSVIK